MEEGGVVCVREVWCERGVVCERGRCDVCEREVCVREGGV